MKKTRIPSETYTGYVKWKVTLMRKVISSAAMFSPSLNITRPQKAKFCRILSHDAMISKGSNCLRTSSLPSEETKKSLRTLTEGAEKRPEHMSSFVDDYQLFLELGKELNPWLDLIRRLVENTEAIVKIGSKPCY